MREISYIILSAGSHRSLSFPPYPSSCVLRIHSQIDFHFRIPFRECENSTAWITSMWTTINIIPDWKAVWVSVPPLKQYGLPEKLWPEVKVKDALTERRVPCQKRLERKSFVSAHPLDLVRIDLVISSGRGRKSRCQAKAHSCHAYTKTAVKLRHGDLLIQSHTLPTSITLKYTVRAQVPNQPTQRTETIYKKNEMFYPSKVYGR